MPKRLLSLSKANNLLERSAWTRQARGNGNFNLYLSFAFHQGAKKSRLVPRGGGRINDIGIVFVWWCQNNRREAGSLVLENDLSGL